MKQKKLLSVIMLFLGLMVLGACQSNTSSKEKVAYFETKQNGTIMDLTYYYQGDKVTRQLTKTKASYAAIGADSKETAKKVLEPISKQYQGVKGLKEAIDYKDDHIIETVTVDYSKASIKELSKIKGMMLTKEDGKLPKYISYTKSAKMLEEQGFKKVDKLSITD
ncbi:putative lipoprotein [Streptococcus porcinus]|uniref:YehR family lipoprotein n=1 Tax=Streptococcus porcinus TaxID=1340 RepID=UPI0010CABF82|nr:YehR family protein [Streptococcus porcinus]VTS41722.1 putative lipoprotein [Streptococcus porcinus]